MSRRDLTTHERLILVAIMVLLAAIAVPYYIEARMRTKIGRTMMDMRKVGAAAEAYYGDRRTYPSPFFPGPQPDPASGFTAGKWFVALWTADGEFMGMGTQLTTPVAYISELPIDTFNSRYILGHARKEHGFVGAGFLYMADLYHPLTLAVEEPLTFEWDVGYFLQSVGPKLVIQDHERPGALYDPTNGLISPGDIYYLGRGHGFFGQDRTIESP